MKNRSIVFALSILLFLSIFPTNAFAAGNKQASLINGIYGYTNGISIEENDETKIGETAGTDYTKDEVFVKFKSDAGKYDIAKTLNSLDSETEQILGDGNWVVASVPADESVISFMEVMATRPDVEYVQPNYKYYLEQTVTDPYAQQSDLDQWHLEKIGVFDAWDTTMGSSAVKVAVLDTGIDFNHPEFAGQIYRQKDVVNNDGNAQDDNGHGTHVCGIIAAKANNGKGGSGIAPGVKLIVVDVFAKNSDGWYATTQDLIEGITYAVNNGADVINISLGNYVYGRAEKEAVDGAVNDGVVVVAAAGNKDTDFLHYPSDFDSCISVTATDIKDKRAAWSGYGPKKDIAAPGVDIYAPKLNGDYISYDGTSMASPVVAGVVALMLSARPELTVGEVKNILYNTAKDLGDPGRDMFFGHGRVDAAAAVVGKVGPEADPEPAGTFLGPEEDCYYHDLGNGTCVVRQYVGTDPYVTIPDKLGGLTVVGIGEQAFSFGMQYEVKMPKTVKFICDEAFCYNKLKSISLPSGLKWIGERAFAQNHLTSVTIPGNVAVISKGAFTNNSLSSFKLPSGTSKWYNSSGTSFKDGNTITNLNSSYHRVPEISISSNDKFVHTYGSEHIIKYTIDQPGLVTVRITDSNKKTVRNIIYKKPHEGKAGYSGSAAGQYSVKWDGFGSDGKKVPSGTYSICVINTIYNEKYGSTYKTLKYENKFYPEITSDSKYIKNSNNKFKISYQLKFSGKATVRITDNAGKTVKNIVYQTTSLKGGHTLYWDGKDSKGKLVASGNYKVSVIEYDNNNNYWFNKKPVQVSIVTTPTITTDSSYSKTTNNQHLIKFSISQDSKVTVAIRDRNNKTIRYINNKTDYAEGTYSVYWDGKDKNGNVVKSGDYYIYVIRYNEDGSYKYSKKGLKVTIEQSPKISSNSTYTRTGKNRHLIKVDIAVPSSVSTCIRDANSKTIIYLENKVSHEDGQIKLYWDGKDKRGNDVPNGEYYIFAIKYKDDGSYVFAKKKLILK